MRTIAIEDHWQDVTEWVEAQGLDVWFSLAHPLHDVLHLVYGLSTQEEGIVMVLEECIISEQLMTQEAFAREACSFLEGYPDSFSPERASQVWEQLAADWPVKIIPKGEKEFSGAVVN